MVRAGILSEHAVGSQQEGPEVIGNLQFVIGNLRLGGWRDCGAPKITNYKLPITNRKLRQRGFTMVELIVAVTIMAILSAAALPVVRVTIQRRKETELRRDLWEMRDAIDRYKDAADRGAFQTKLGSEGYPPDLDT